MEYLLANKRYVLHYQELRGQYIEICEMSDEEFLANLPKALHLACIICFVKEIPSYECLSDIGIIHQLTHLIDIQKTVIGELKEIRELFKSSLLLAA
jgi:bacterioferritin (cytochrome b1)